MRFIDTIFVHCTATPPNWRSEQTSQQRVQGIKQIHKSSPFNFTDIGYHFLIDRDGSVHEGRPINKAGAHARGYNDHSIGISLFGGYESRAYDTFSEHYTSEQDTALRELITQLKGEYPIIQIRGHNSIPNAGKACPGFQVQKWLNRQPTPEPEQPTVKTSTSLQGNLTNIVSGGGLTTAAAFYQGFDDMEKYILLGVGGLVLVVGLVLFRKKLMKIVERHEL